jgi:hypothetical protein
MQKKKKRNGKHYTELYLCILRNANHIYTRRSTLSPLSEASLYGECVNLL